MRISELPLTTNPTSTDDLPIDRSGVTYRVKYEALRGPKGDPGENGTIENLDVAATTLPAGSQATASYENNLLTLGIPQGAKGNPGTNGQDGVGVPSGGTTGQVLKKKSGADYDTEWANESGGGGGGTWGSITGTLSDQTDLQTALNNAGSKAIKIAFSISGYGTGTWSNKAVWAGAPSGGTCYQTNRPVTGISESDMVFVTSIVGCSGAVYAFCRDNTLYVEMEAPPDVSVFFFSGYIIKSEGGNVAVAATKYIASVSGLTNDAGYITPSYLALQDISSLYTFTKTAGNAHFTDISAVRMLNLVNIGFTISYDATTAEGQNVIEGTLSGGPLPANNAIQLAGYLGMAGIIMDLRTDGTCYVKTIAGAAGAPYTRVISISFLTND